MPARRPDSKMTIQKGSAISSETVECAGSFEEASHRGGVRHQQARSSSLTQNPLLQGSFLDGSDASREGSAVVNTPALDRTGASKRGSLPSASVNFERASPVRLERQMPKKTRKIGGNPILNPQWDIL